MLENIMLENIILENILENIILEICEFLVNISITWKVKTPTSHTRIVHLATNKDVKFSITGTIASNVILIQRWIFSTNHITCTVLGLWNGRPTKSVIIDTTELVSVLNLKRRILPLCRKRLLPCHLLRRVTLSALLWSRVFCKLLVWWLYNDVGDWWIYFLRLINLCNGIEFFHLRFAWITSETGNSLYKSFTPFYVYHFTKFPASTLNKYDWIMKISRMSLDIYIHRFAISKV